MATLSRLKLYQKKDSRKRSQHQTVDQIHQGIGDHENQAHYHQVCHDQRYVTAGNGLQEHQTNARPLEHCLGENGVGHHDADLHATHGNHWQHGVLERVQEINPTGTEALGPGVTNVITLQDFHHLGTDETDEQRQHDRGQRYRWQDQMHKTTA